MDPDSGHTSDPLPPPAAGDGDMQPEGDRLHGGRAECQSGNGQAGLGQDHGRDDWEAVRDGRTCGTANKEGAIGLKICGGCSNPLMPDAKFCRRCSIRKAYEKA